MRKPIPILPLLLLPFSVLAQVEGPSATLENDILSTLLGPSLRLFQVGDVESQGLTFTPEDTGIEQTLIYTSSLWYGGLSEDTLYMTASRYDEPELDDATYSSFGPISGAYDGAFEALYNRVWAVNRSDIEAHLAQFDSPGYTVPEVLATYPGNGRSELGESHLLLPFVDLNDNGLYEPELGDHPRIRGDRCVTWVVNDASNGADDRPHIETVMQAYVFHDGPVELQHSLFLSAQLRNRSDRDYSDFSIGMFVDGDVTHFADNYVGCDADDNYAYTYSPFPASSIEFGPFGMPSNVATLFPSDNLYSHMSFLNSAADNGVPFEPAHFYGYLNATWKNGEPLTYGGDGFSDVNGETLTTSFMYPDFLWAEEEDAWDGLDLPAADVTHVMAIAPQEFAAGDVRCFHVAFVASAQFTGLEALYTMDSRVDALQAWWDAQANTDCLETGTVLSESARLETADIGLFPNPTTGRVVLNGLSGSSPQSVVLKDLSGRTVQRHTVSAAQAEFNVSTLPSGLYFATLEEEGVSLPLIRD